MQLAEAPVPARVHDAALKVPVPLLVKVTAPVGVVGVAEVSMTVARHDVVWLTITEPGVQVTEVVVTGRVVKVNIAGVEWTSGPLVPVMVTENGAAVVELQDRVAPPPGGKLILLGVISPQFSPVGTTSVRMMVPVNPLRAVTVMVDVSVEPTFPVGSVASMVKSVTWKSIAAVVFDLELLVPVTATV